MSSSIAKVFWSGRSQAVRLPKEYRFASDRVRIRREGDAVVLEPVRSDWDWLDEIVGQADEDFLRAIEEDPGEQPPVMLDDPD